MGRDAGGDEIADAGEAAEGFGAGAQRDPEASDLDESAGDEGGFGVVAGAQAIEDAGGEGDDVLEGAGQLDAEDVAARVDAEPGGAERVLQQLRDSGRLRGNDRGGGEAPGELAGDVGARQDADRIAADVLGDNLARACAGADFEALGAAADRDAGRDRWAVALPLAAQILTRDRRDDQPTALEGHRGVVRRRDTLRQRDARQIPAVLVAGKKFLDRLTGARQEGDADAVAGEYLGGDGAHGADADYCGVLDHAGLSCVRAHRGGHFSADSIGRPGPWAGFQRRPRAAARAAKAR